MGYKIIIVDENQANKELIGNLLAKIKTKGILEYKSKTRYPG